jgi:hypothetical protein
MEIRNVLLQSLASVGLVEGSRRERSGPRRGRGRLEATLTWRAQGSKWGTGMLNLPHKGKAGTRQACFSILPMSVGMQNLSSYGQHLPYQTLYGQRPNANVATKPPVFSVLFLDSWTL